MEVFEHIKHSKTWSGSLLMNFFCFFNPSGYYLFLSILFFVTTKPNAMRVPLLWSKDHLPWWLFKEWTYLYHTQTLTSDSLLHGQKYPSFNVAQRQVFTSPSALCQTEPSGLYKYKIWLTFSCLISASQWIYRPGIQQYGLPF